MGIDVQVAPGPNVEIEHAVTGDLIEHMVEERHPGGKLGPAAAVEVHLDGDRRLLRAAFDARAAAGAGGGPGLGIVHRQSSVQAASSKSFSSGVPTVIRRQFASSGCQPCTFLTRIRRAFSPSNIAFASATRTSTKFVWLGNTVVSGSRRSAASSRAR